MFLRVLSALTVIAEKGELIENILITKKVGGVLPVPPTTVWFVVLSVGGAYFLWVELNTALSVGGT